MRDINGFVTHPKKKKKGNAFARYNRPTGINSTTQAIYNQTSKRSKPSSLARRRPFLLSKAQHFLSALYSRYTKSQWLIFRSN
jgi:hypothetical protein